MRKPILRSKQAVGGRPWMIVFQQPASYVGALQHRLHVPLSVPRRRLDWIVQVILGHRLWHLIALTVLGNMSQLFIAFIWRGLQISTEKPVPLEL